MGLKLDNKAGTREAQAALFNIYAAGGSWLLLSYVGRDIVHFSGGGESGPEDLRYRLEEDQIQYELVRLDVPGQTGSGSTRDVFVQWKTRWIC